MLTPLFSLASKRYHAHLSSTPHGTPDDKVLIVAGLMQLTITKYERPHFWEIGTHQLIRADIQQARTRKADFNIMQQRSNSDVYL